MRIAISALMVLIFVVGAILLNVHHAYTASGIWAFAAGAWTVELRVVLEDD